MLKEELKRRNLPALPTREEMMEIIQREQFGYLPSVKEYSVCADNPVVVERRYSCGAVTHSYVNLTITVGQGSHTFRLDRFLHVDGKRVTKFACVDGPDFNAYEIDFDEAMSRGRAYQDFERHAYESTCNLLNKEVR